MKTCKNVNYCSNELLMEVTEILRDRQTDRHQVTLYYRYNVDFINIKICEGITDGLIMTFQEDGNFVEEYAQLANTFQIPNTYSVCLRYGNLNLPAKK